MRAAAVVVGTAGVVFVLVGLVGGGFTFSGSVMPKVGKLARTFCSRVGGTTTLVVVERGRRGR